MYSESAHPKSKSPGTGKVSNGAISIFPPPAISWPTYLPTSPRQPATNQAKPEKPMDAAAGSDSHAERGNRAAEICAKEREKE